MVAKYYKDRNNHIACLAVLSAGVSIYISNAFTGCYFLPFWIIAVSKAMAYAKSLNVRKNDSPKIKLDKLDIK